MKKLILMKPGEDSVKLAQRLQTSGFSKDNILVWPAFEFQLPQNFDKENFLKEVEGATLVVVSPTAAKALKQLVPDLPQSTQLASVGKPTADILTQLFAPSKPVIYPEGEVKNSGSEVLFEKFLELGFPAKVVIARGQTGREYLFEELKKRNVEVLKIVIYERIPLVLSIQEKNRLSKGDELIVLLTSSDSVDILWNNLGSEFNATLQKGRFLTIHRRIADKLIAKGANSVQIIPSDANSIFDHFIEHLKN